jgi:hypothetical protein
MEQHPTRKYPLRYYCVETLIMKYLGMVDSETVMSG